MTGPQARPRSDQGRGPAGRRGVEDDPGDEGLAREVAGLPDGLTRGLTFSEMKSSRLINSRLVLSETLTSRLTLSSSASTALEFAPLTAPTNLVSMGYHSGGEFTSRVNQHSSTVVNDDEAGVEVPATWASRVYTDPSSGLFAFCGIIVILHFMEKYARNNG